MSPSVTRQGTSSQTDPLCNRGGRVGGRGPEEVEEERGWRGGAVGRRGNKKRQSEEAAAPSLDTQVPSTSLSVPKRKQNSIHV